MNAKLGSPAERRPERWSEDWSEELEDWSE